MEDTKQLTVIYYLEQALNNKYIENIRFDKVSKTKIAVTITVSHQARIKPTLMMIEANMITRKEFIAKNVTYINNSLFIQTFNNIDYYVNIVAKSV